MLNRLLTAMFRQLGEAPCFQIYGKARRETAWRTIDVFATARRDRSSRWPRPFWPGTCITWTSQVIAVGWDFAASVLREQVDDPATRERPVVVAGGRLRDQARRTAAGSSPLPSYSEVLAHECGHTAQVRRLGPCYWPWGGALTLFREGGHFWNSFENQASEEGQFGGLVTGSVCPILWSRQ